MRISGMLAVAVVTLAAVIWFGRDHDVVLLVAGGLVLAAAAFFLLRGGRGASVDGTAPRRTPTTALALLVLLVVGAAGALVVLRGPSAQAVRTEVADLPGVAGAAARAVDGDEGTRWKTARLDVRAVMEPDASAEEIERVVDTVRDEMRSGDVASLLLVVRQKHTIRATASADFGHEDAAHLVSVRGDSRVVNWLAEGDTLNVWLESGLPLGAIASFWTAQREATGLPQVTVRRGRFSLVWDEQNDDLKQTAARLDLTKAINRTIPLTGAFVSGRGSLALFLSPSKVPDARQWLKAHQRPGVGRVLINPAGDGPW